MGLSVVSKNRLFRLIFLISILIICLGCGDTQNINIDQIPVETETSSNSDVLPTEEIEEEFNNQIENDLIDNIEASEE